MCGSMEVTGINRESALYAKTVVSWISRRTHSHPPAPHTHTHTHTHTCTCTCTSSPPLKTIGIRDSRKIVGQYDLTRADVFNEARFDDTVGIFPEFIDG